MERIVSDGNDRARNDQLRNSAVVKSTVTDDLNRIGDHNIFDGRAAKSAVTDDLNRIGDHKIFDGRAAKSTVSDDQNRIGARAVPAAVQKGLGASVDEAKPLGSVFEVCGVNREAFQTIAQHRGKFHPNQRFGKGSGF